MQWLRKKWVRRLLVSTAGIGLLAALLVVGMGRETRARRQVEGCEESLRVIARACEMYSVHNDGRYPCEDLPLETPPDMRLARFRERMIPDFLKSVPTCPTAHADTYSNSYIVDGPHHYVVFCEGTYHQDASAPADFPRCEASRGVRRQPDRDDPVDVIGHPLSTSVRVSVGEMKPGMGEMQARALGAQGEPPMLTWLGGDVFIGHDDRVAGISSKVVRWGTRALKAGWPRQKVEAALGPPTRLTFLQHMSIAEYRTPFDRLQILYDAEGKVTTYLLTR